MTTEDETDELRMIGSMIVNLNFDLLRHQKHDLQRLLDPGVDKLTKNIILSGGDLGGIVHLISVIQESAISAGRKTEAEVFGKEETGE